MWYRAGAANLQSPLGPLPFSLFFGINSRSQDFFLTFQKALAIPWFSLCFSEVAEVERGGILRSVPTDTRTVTSTRSFGSPLNRVVTAWHSWGLWHISSGNYFFPILFVLVERPIWAQNSVKFEKWQLNSSKTSDIDHMKGLMIRFRWRIQRHWSYIDDTITSPFTFVHIHLSSVLTERSKPSPERMVLYTDRNLQKQKFGLLVREAFSSNGCAADLMAQIAHLNTLRLTSCLTIDEDFRAAVISTYIRTWAEVLLSLVTFYGNGSLIPATFIPPVRFLRWWFLLVLKSPLILYSGPEKQLTTEFPSDSHQNWLVPSVRKPGHAPNSYHMKSLAEERQSQGRAQRWPPEPLSANCSLLTAAQEKNKYGAENYENQLATHNFCIFFLVSSDGGGGT